MKRNVLLLTLAILLVAQCCLAEDADDVRVHVNAMQRTGRLEPFWSGQMIHPTESLLTDRGRDFLRMAAATGAARQHIRIYNQPEEAIRVAADGKITYDWRRFDEMAGLILATGNKLKVVFFGMP